MLPITVTPATGVGLIFSKLGFFSIERDCSPGLGRTRTIRHVRTEHSKIRNKTDLLVDMI